MWLAFLGSQVPYAADLNLIAQAVTIFLLVAGAFLARTARLRLHARLMRLAIMIQIGALILWMGPSLLLNIGAFGSLGFGPFITALHVLSGVLALMLAISAAYHRRIGSWQLKWTMRSAFFLWVLAVIIGISFYAYYYLL